MRGVGLGKVCNMEAYEYVFSFSTKNIPVIGMGQNQECRLGSLGKNSQKKRK